MLLHTKCSTCAPLPATQDLSQLPDAFSVVSYAFYLAPLMMPLIREMPGDGLEGLGLLQKAMHLTLLGACCACGGCGAALVCCCTRRMRCCGCPAKHAQLAASKFWTASSYICKYSITSGSVLFIYASCGFFGAAIYGPDAQGNIMLNDILPPGHPWAVVVVYGSMQLFLCFGAALAQYPLRTSLDVLLMGEHVPMTTARSVRLVVCVLCSASTLPLNLLPRV